MPSKLILDPAEPGIQDVIAGAAVGTPITLREITITPTVVSPQAFEADVTKITVDQEEVGESESQPPGAGGGKEPGGIPPGMPTENTGGFDTGTL